MRIMGTGQAVEIYKEVGRPEEVADRFALAAMAGSHGIGHTRMATELAVTTHGRASVLDRRRPVPGAQWLAFEPQQCPPRARSAKA